MGDHGAGSCGVLAAVASTLYGGAGALVCRVGDIGQGDEEESVRANVGARVC